MVPVDYELEAESGVNEAGELDEVDQVLHDLCQPLTTLRCRLELAGLIGTADAYQEAVSLGLVECVRLVKGVESMREIVRTAKGE